jgi:hypothetical protein
MLRKTVITGVIMFVSIGSLLQMVVALLFTLAFSFTAAWCQPFVDQRANLFKIATELCLIVSLSLGILLRFDLSNEEAMGEDVVGMLMLITNIVLPAAAILAGATLEVSQNLEGETDDGGDQDATNNGGLYRNESMEFENPLHNILNVEVSSNITTADNVDDGSNVLESDAPVVGRKMIKMSLSDLKKKEFNVFSVDSELSTRDAPDIDSDRFEVD